MPKGYWIARVDVAEPEAFKAYEKAIGTVFAKHGARFVVRGGPFETAEGTARQRNIVLEFESYERAIACWHSDEYQRVLELRTPVSTADLIIIPGYDGPQPDET